MISEYLNSFAKLGVGQAFEPRFGDGRFTIVNKTMAHAKIGSVIYSSNLELSSDFQISGFKYGQLNQAPKTSYYGYNRKYLDEDGVYDPLRAIDEYSRTAPGLRLVKADLIALATTSNLPDSHEAFILNMLISWYKARLYKDMNGKNDKFIVKESGYKDSHLAFKWFDSIDERDIEISLGSPVGEDISELGFAPRTLDNFWDRPYVLRYTSTNLEQVSFYLLHVMGRTGSSALNVDINIPGIDTNELLLDGVGGSTFAAISTELVPWDRPETLWLWIMDYVRLNRVEHAFAAALELLGSIAAQPMPSYQESNLWQHSEVTINLAPFSPVRARVPSNLTGEPNIYDLNASQVTLEEGRAPQNFLVVSAVLNYAMWIGMFALVDNYATDLLDWRGAYLSRDAELGILGTRDARAALISLVTGKEIITCATPNCYLTFNLSQMAQIDRLVADRVVEPGYPTEVIIHGVPSYVSGSLLLGAVACDTDATAHLKPAYTFEVDRYGTCSVQDALKLASTYRLFGHDVQLSHEHSGEIFPMYANVNDAVVASYELMARTRPFDKVMVLDSERRTGRSDLIPAANCLFTHGQVHVTIEMPKLDVTPWGRRRHVFRPVMMLQSRRKPVTFKVASTSEYSSSHFKVVNKSEVVRQGFHEATMELAPSHPTASTVVASTVAQEDRGADEPALDAE
jgi:hypothetical protein